MNRSTQKELISQLSRHGMKFSQFTFVNEGDYLPTDADWNYKDVPHLNLVHELVDACYGAIGDDYIATVNMQKILGIRFPLSVFNYQSEPDRQTYFANFFVYQLIIETTYKKVGPLRTQVSTNYAVGSSPFWQLFVPVIKWVMKKNYDNLMSADTPMRDRRGELRKWGYTFKGDLKPYSFQDTMKISESNLVVPSTPPIFPNDTRISLKELKEKKSILVGRADAYGLRILHDERNQILVFPRTCPHEGASLDTSACKKSTISCPWHGRAFNPIARLTQACPAVESANYSFKISEDELSIQFKQSTPFAEHGGVTLA